jgi:hypothetical protein
MWHKALREASVAGGFWRFLSFSVLKYHQKYHQPERVRWVDLDAAPAPARQQLRRPVRRLGGVLGLGSGD